MAYTNNFHSKYQFLPLFKYIPSRYQYLTDWQQGNQRLVYEFKEGHCTEEHMKLFVDAILKVVKDQPQEWVVSYVPASTKAKHHNRFCNLATYIKEHTGCLSDPNLIYRDYDHEPVHRTGHTGQIEDLKLKDNFDYHKKFILIDDLITTGKSFRTVGDKLMEKGALTVKGIIFAMTIHPNLPIKK